MVRTVVTPARQTHTQITACEVEVDVTRYHNKYVCILTHFAFVYQFYDN